MKPYIIIFLIGIFLSQFLLAQSDSVDVTFYYSTDDFPTNVYLPGEFNGWSLNSSSAMTQDPATGIWSRTVRLRVSGPFPLPAPNSIPGAYQYKFNSDGSWMQDPLNPRYNVNDNNNSYLYIKNPTINYLLPNSTPASGIIRTRFPEISAYIFPAKNSSVDTSSLKITIDEIEYTSIGRSYDSEKKLLSFIPTNPLPNGVHKLNIFAMSSTGSSNSDSTTFTVQGGLVQLLTMPSETWKTSWRLQGAIFDNNGEIDTTISVAQINRADSSWIVEVNNGLVDTTLYLHEGNNFFTLEAEINGVSEVSDSLNILHKINKTPTAKVSITQLGETLSLSASQSADPDSQQLSYLWGEDPSNPELLGITGQTAEEIQVSKPVTAGEYYVSLSVTDTDLNADSNRTFFVVDDDNFIVKVAEYEDNPEWLKNGRIYLLFFKAFTPAGTIKAAIPNLEYIKAMGFNIIWVLPITEIPGDVDNQINIGYNIIDFLKVESSLGTKEDYKEFVDTAHDLGIKVIQDITPNHTGKEHPFAKEAALNRDLSQYWNYYQTVSIPHNTNGLGECVTPEGIYYYCAFSDALLNYNWSDLDGRNYMIDVYKYWVSQFGVDGYRFDVYWGPHRRYGEDDMGIPVRTSLKHIKPDLLLLGEQEGTGPGTEVVYADQDGGLDAAYDWSLYWNGIRSFGFNSTSVNALHSKLANAGYYPGENAYYLRYLENQDEDRITYIFNSFEKTMPLATSIFMAPGLVQMLNGQEVGFGKGMGASGEPDLNDRRRGIIDWNFSGKELLTPHYQKLAQIRAQFTAFSQHRMDTNGDGNVDSQDKSDFDRLDTGNGIVYSFLRPYKDSNGLAIMNFSNEDQSVTIDLTNVNLEFSDDFSLTSSYWVNDLYNGSSTQVLGSDLAAFTVSLGTYGSAIYTISTQEEMVYLPTLPPIVKVEKELNSLPNSFELSQNYPNPFNPSTTIKYSIPSAASGFSLSNVTLKVYDILSREVATLVNEQQSPGNYEVTFNASNLTSGMYFYYIKAGEFRSVKKMILLK
ncbi:Alkaline phosphatase [hydrothermal vent metagenome]|uniref:Alkaline phosphatase n=1 Tax=hydrothermal vent metagenome TaxID=652676 RepID=A0A3B1D1G2_9ZZZZ